MLFMALPTLAAPEDRLSDRLDFSPFVAQPVTVIVKDRMVSVMIFLIEFSLVVDVAWEA